jgi:hypothetical protein
MGVIAAAATIAAVLLPAPASARAQDQSSKQSVNPTNVAVKDAATAGTPATVTESARPGENAKTAAAPAFGGYKGVKIGMSADEVRRLLGNLKEKSKDQDFFAFSESETAQVFYDSAGKVTAVAVSFYGAKSGAPEPAAVLGKNVEAKEDGSLYRRERYADAGYWVSYSRTAGDSPLVTITIQKIP